jgi:ribosome biogenesis GTPase / thiamine phosphate phosphatase
MSELTSIGWTPALDAAFAPFRERGLVAARVALEHNHVYRLLIPGGAADLLAEGRHGLPAVGDWVAVRLGPSGSRATIDAILPRRSQFSRKAPGRGTEQQVVAANIDVVLLVFSLDGPLKARRIERYLVPARQSGSRPVVVLNKADLCADVAAALSETAAVASGTPVFAVSAHDPHSLEPLRALATAGQTLALLGPSGAGKSSIINALAGRKILETGAVRSWDARGRHTSVHRQLVQLSDGGCVIDTPGLRELQVWESDDAADRVFEDLAAFAAQCRFRDCRHDREPGCAVKAAVEAGTLDARRYENYLTLGREREALDEKRAERSQLDERRHTKVVHKALKRMQRDRDR